jgi:sugar lactone lactonase YvrE
VAAPDGSVLVADSGNARIRRIAADGTISTLVGDASNPIGAPWAIVVDPDGNLYFSELNAHRVRKLATDGSLTIVAGTGIPGFLGDGGPATSARLAGPAGLALDASGNLYIADHANHRIRRVAPDGTISTAAGGSGEFLYPMGVAVDGDGHLLVADTEHHRVSRVEDDGTVTAVAGNGSQGYSGDGGAATSAQLAFPFGVAVDVAGDVFVADSANHRIRRIAPDGTISTLAGTGEAGFSGDGGPATSAALQVPSGVALDEVGDLLVADTSNHRIRRVFLAEAANPLTIDAGEDATIRSDEQSVTILVGTAASTVTKDELTFRWLEGETVLVGPELMEKTTDGLQGPLPLALLETLPVGDHVFTFEVTGLTATQSDEVVVTIENSPPTATPSGGGEFALGATVTLGGAVSDHDGDDLSYEWRLGDGVLASGEVSPEAGGSPASLPDLAIDTSDLGVGTHTVRLVVDDGVNAEVEAPIVIEVFQPEAAAAPTADAYLKDGHPNKNQGDESILRVRANGHNRALVRFDEADIESGVAGRTLVSARLRMYIVDNADNWGSDGREVAVFRMKSAWTEGGVTWNSPDDSNTGNSKVDGESWEMGGNDETAWPFVADPTDSALHTNGLAGWVEWDVTADVAAFLAGTATNHGWLVKKVLEGQPGLVEYASREASANAPVLVLTVD